MGDLIMQKLHEKQVGLVYALWERILVVCWEQLSGEIHSSQKVGVLRLFSVLGFDSFSSAGGRGHPCHC